jgi:hypothetical protein
MIQSQQPRSLVIQKLDWENMSASEQLRHFSKDKAILILDNDCLSPQFSAMELVKFVPSLSRQMNVQSKLL